MVPLSCFEMQDDYKELSVYEELTTKSHHCFCSKCGQYNCQPSSVAWLPVLIGFLFRWDDGRVSAGVHIFHVDVSQCEHIAVNVYCLEEENFDDIKMVFVPKGARPVLHSNDSKRAMPPQLHNQVDLRSTTRHTHQPTTVTDKQHVVF